jgi:hypothetical protein
MIVPSAARWVRLRGNHAASRTRNGLGLRLLENHSHINFSTRQEAYIKWDVSVNVVLGATALERIFPPFNLSFPRHILEPSSQDRF